jgi:NAD-dependent deacetylase
MQVYPAASLIHYVSSNTPIYFIDPAPSISKNTNTTIIKSGAQQGTKQLIKMLVG